mmetsp:Transcript_7662/g.14686  ORF Transcript_7662/g.14686 Transcript_7662/m.14686 type:complete len:244 (+) Transcript_7662:1542-2273(+)
MEGDLLGLSKLHSHICCFRGCIPLVRTRSVQRWRRDRSEARRLQGRYLRGHGLWCWSPGCGCQPKEKALRPRRWRGTRRGCRAGGRQGRQTEPGGWQLTVPGDPPRTTVWRRAWTAPSPRVRGLMRGFAEPCAARRGSGETWVRRRWTCEGRRGLRGSEAGTRRLPPAWEALRGWPGNGAALRGRQVWGSWAGPGMRGGWRRAWGAWPRARRGRRARGRWIGTGGCGGWRRCGSTGARGHRCP